MKGAEPKRNERVNYKKIEATALRLNKGNDTIYGINSN